MTIKQPFYPQTGSNQVLTAGAASLTTSINAKCKQVRITNSGAAKGYVRTYNSVNGAQPATVADLVVLPNAVVTITKDEGHDQLSYISATGTTLEVMTGEGF
jgi:hypothetical protein